MDEDQKKCGGISLVGIVAIIVSLACIVIGAYNITNISSGGDVHSKCDVEPNIPFYLVVAGAINIMLIICRLIFQVINSG